MVTQALINVGVGMIANITPFSSFTYLEYKIHPNP